MFSVTQFSGFGGGGIVIPATANITLSPAGTYKQAADDSVIDQTVNVGSESNNKKIIICCFGGNVGNVRTCDTVTVAGGGSATKIVSDEDQVTCSSSIWLLDYNGTGNKLVTCTWNSTLSRGGFAILELLNAGASANSTATNSSSPTPSTTINKPANGCVIGVAGGEGGSFTLPSSWTGLDINSNFDVEGTHRASVARLNTVAADASLAVDVTFLSATAASMCLASFAPA